MSFTHIIKENPGCVFRRAGERYFNSFDWHQSYEQNINFPIGKQA
jgi:hypothetical protein